MVYDDLFATVPLSELDPILETEVFDSRTWNRLIETGIECNTDLYDDDGNSLPLPELSEEWLSEREIQECKREQIN